MREDSSIQQQLLAGAAIINHAGGSIDTAGANMQYCCLYSKGHTIKV